MNNPRFLAAAAIVAVPLFLVACGSETLPADDVVDALDNDQAGQDIDNPPDIVNPDPGHDAREDMWAPDADDVENDIGEADGDIATDIPADGTDAIEDVPVEPDPALRLRAEGWLSGDLHIHTTYSDAEDSLAITIGLAEYFQDPAFLAFHPEYAGNPMDFMAITDHRTAEQDFDPDFHSDKVVLIPGEEFGTPGHANLFGVTGTVEHNPDGGAVTLQNYQDGLERAASMGAVRSINHPYTTGIYFPWDTHSYESMEIWNVKWAVSQPGATQESIDEWEAAKGATANTIYRKGAQYQGIGGNAQALKFYEALLSRGYHVALVGGSDRHTVFDIGFPATWARPDTRDVEGLKNAIRARHTFVSRTPVSSTIEMTVSVGGRDYEVGDQVPVAAAGQEVTIKLRVTRDKGGRLFLIGGHHVASDEELAAAELGVYDVDAAIDSNDFQTEFSVTVQPGDWFYPVVWDPLVPEGLDPELEAAIPDIAATVAQIRDEDYSPLIAALFPYVDDLTFMTPDQCDPAGWKADISQCMPPDNNGMATIFLPDWIDRVLNVIVENGVSSTQWSMGAVASAMLFIEATPEE